MKGLLLCALAFLGSAACSTAADSTPSEMSDRLRALVLNLAPNDVGITRENYPHAVFALIMDTGFTNSSVTLALVADGTTSLYFSNGGGIIGAGEHADVRKASSSVLAEAQDVFLEAREVSSYRYPETGEVIFYFVSFDGVRSYAAQGERLTGGKDEFSDLYAAAQGVITELRRVQTASENPPPN